MTEKYTKDDYLTPLKYAKLYGITEEMAKKAMKLARLRGATIKIGKGSTKRDAVIYAHGKYHVRPEPAAHQVLAQIIQELKNKGTSK